MCRAAKCRTCGKTTWAGCGQHVAQVKKVVPTAEWCGGKHSPAEMSAARAERGGLFARLFNR
nr:hypothetical protein [Brevibacterium yomogidense]